MKKIILTLALSLSMIIPAFAYAVTDKPVDTVAVPDKSVDIIKGVVPTAHLENPLGNVNTLSELFTKIVDFVLSFSYIVIACFLILSGFKFVAAQGSDEGLKKAKQTFYYTLIGAAIIIAAQTITAVVQSIIQGLQK